MKLRLLSTTTTTCNNYCSEKVDQQSQEKQKNNASNNGLEEEQEEPLQDDQMKTYVALLKAGTILALVLISLNVLGSFDYLVEYDYSKHFRYPLDVDLSEMIKSGRHSASVDRSIISAQWTIFSDHGFSCKNGSGNLLLLIKSKLTSFGHRDVIRKTWAQNREIYTSEGSLVSIRHKFQIGSLADDERPHQATNVARLVDEASTFGDILLQPIADSDDTGKLLMQLQFVASIDNACNNSGSDFILAFDENYRLSLSNLLLLLDDLTQDQNGDVLIGQLQFGRPSRLKTSSRYVSLFEYPFNAYPPHVSQDAFLLSRQTANKLFTAAQYTKPFRFADVYIGILCKKLNLQPQHYQDFISCDRATIERQNSIALCNRFR